MYYIGPIIHQENSDSDVDDESVGAQAPPLTKQISNILNRYPEGGQILKVCKLVFLWHHHRYHGMACHTLRIML